jgi:hypothetical protein
MNYFIFGFLFFLSIQVITLRAESICNQKDCAIKNDFSAFSEKNRSNQHLFENRVLPSLVSVNFLNFSSGKEQEKAIDIEDLIDADRDPAPPTKEKEVVKQDDSRRKGYFKIGRFNILKSAIVPGWTQYDYEEKVKAPLFFFSFYGTALYLWHTQNVYTKQRDDYERHTNYMWGYREYAGPTIFGYLTANKMFAESSETAHRAENLSLLLVTIYVVNVIDAIFFCNDKTTASLKSPTQKKEGLSFNSFSTRTLPGQRSESTYQLDYTMRF